MNRGFHFNFVSYSVREYYCLNEKKDFCFTLSPSSGGVGIAATQLCQTVKDVTVFGTASASKHETISEGGVTHPIDYRTKDYVEEVRKLSPKGQTRVRDGISSKITPNIYRSLLFPLALRNILRVQHVLIGVEQTAAGFRFKRFCCQQNLLPCWQADGKHGGLRTSADFQFCLSSEQQG